MFNIGPGELIAIAAVALIVLGPQRLPQALRSVGRVVGELRRISGGFQDELRRALDEAEVGGDDDPNDDRDGRKAPNVIGAPAIDATSTEVEGATAVSEDGDGSVADETSVDDEDDDEPERIHLSADEDDEAAASDDSSADASPVDDDVDDEHDEPERAHVPIDERPAAGNGNGIGEVEGATPITDDSDEPVDDEAPDPAVDAAAGDGDERAAS